MSEPVYQIDVTKTGTWFECTKEQFEEIQYTGAAFVNFRILYPSTAYEAQRSEVERLKAENEVLRSSLFNSEAQANIISDKANDAVNKLVKQNDALQKEVTHWKANHADLKARLRVATHRTDVKDMEVAKERLKLYDHLTNRIAELEQKSKTPIELECVQNHNDYGFWRPCSGCHETNEGYPLSGAVFSKAFNCYLGCGCSECGGLGAVWDTTDYEKLANEYL